MIRIKRNREGVKVYTYANKELSYIDCILCTCFYKNCPNSVRVLFYILCVQIKPNARASNNKENIKWINNAIN